MRIRPVSSWCLAVAATMAISCSPCLAQPAGFRTARQPVQAITPTKLICEAEEFTADAAWKAKAFGTNFYAATFANCFLSRKAYLGAPEQCETSVATIAVNVPKAGRYLALVRYEACYRFQTQFRLQVEQKGQKKLDRLYGALDNLRIWAFGQKLKKDVAWDWGAVENVVWEGHDAFVDLDAGPATLRLIAGKQPEPAARRNVDLVMLTSDVKDVQDRIAKENYLPLDGLLTQAGDVYLKVHNHAGAGALKLTVGNGTEHSPYWVHVRKWKPVELAVEPGATTEWVEVGSLLDSLNDGQWHLGAVGKGLTFDLEFGVKDAAGTIASIRKLDKLAGDVTLAYDADTRYRRRIRLADEVLYELVEYLRQRPVQGTPPKRTLVYGTTFDRKPKDARYSAARAEFLRMTGATALGREGAADVTGDGLVRGMIDVRDVPTSKLEDYCKKLVAEKRADKIAVVSLGDEIGLAEPSAKEAPTYRAWLQAKGLKPGDVDPAAGTSWDKVALDPSAKAKAGNPGVYYWSKIYGYRYGIKQLKERTDILRKYLPNAGIGANFSPHHGPAYLGTTHQYISLFREGGMTMPWSEDYAWQVPIGSQQMNAIVLDMFRAGIRGKPGMKIHQYVMPHTPGNTPNSWRRLFYASLGHGAKILNLFEYRPVQAAYTENHTSDPAMFQEVRKALHELGGFEDIIQDGDVMPAKTAIFCSETADVWDNNRAPFGAAKRCLWLMLRHQQHPIDFIVESDDLNGFKTIFLCDANVNLAASNRLAAYVRAGGEVIATAGAGMFDEYNRPNQVLRGLFGADQVRLEDASDPIRLAKQDLPFATPLAQWILPGETKNIPIPVFGGRSIVKPTDLTVAFFADKHPAAVVKHHKGGGSTNFLAFLPGLGYLQPAIPKKPVDRGTHDDSMAHSLPTAVDIRGLELNRGVVPVTCSNRFVETTVIRAKQGVVIPLINWQPKAVKGLRVEINIDVPAGKVSLASGGPVQTKRENGRLICTLDLEVADALIVRKVP